MDVLRETVYAKRPETVEEAIEMMHSTISEKLSSLDRESHRLIDKHTDTEYVHYYAGKSMSLRDIDSELGLNTFD